MLVRVLYRGLQDARVRRAERMPSRIAIEAVDIAPRRRIIEALGRQLRFFAAASMTVIAVLSFSSAANAQSPQPPSCPATTGHNYSGQNLTNADFHAAPAGSLVGANFNNANLSGANFSGVDLTGATFQNANLGPSPLGDASFKQANLMKTCFIEAIMNATDFTYAAFNCTDFTDTTLMQASFGPAQTFTSNPACRTKFVGATIDVHAIALANWGCVDFSYTNFQNLSPATFSLSGQNITGAMLVGDNFQAIDMSGANLTQVDFSGAMLNEANLQNAATNAAIFVDTDLAYANLTCARFYYQKGDTQDLNAAICTQTPSTTVPSIGAKLQSANLSNATMTNVTLDYALLNAANLSGTNFKSATFRYASLEATNFLNAATISGTNLSYATFDGAALNSVAFLNSNLGFANFSGTTLANTSFQGSIMPSANFESAVLESVNFAGTVLQNSSFALATLKSVPNGGGAGVNFSCSQLGGADFTKASISQTTFANAVMPPAASQCCPAKAGFSWCGTISSTGQPYGPVTYPKQMSSVTCPNGQSQSLKERTCTATQWQLSPNWTTTNCNLYHTAELMWQEPPCDTPPGGIVKFDDQNLENCILSSLPGSPSYITVQTAEQQLEVVCEGKGIVSLGGLQYFTSLQVLDLAGNKITQFGLTFQNLVQLNLSGNALEQVDLTNMNKIVWLDVSDNQLSSLTGLANAYFQFLDVSNNLLTSLDLSVQSELLMADLHSNKITSVTDTFNKSLSKLTSLTYLDLSNNNISTIGAINSISYSAKNNRNGKLKNFFLACNPTFACSTLGVDGSYPAYQTSQCADFNTASNQWVPNTYPNCPSGN